MDWQYIAGFFDGEGCISWANRGMTPQVFVTQSGNAGHELFVEISGFLTLNDITSRIQKGANRPPRQPNWNLHVGSRDSVVEFLAGILPYLRIKRVLAQDSLRFMRMNPTLRGGGRYSLIRRWQKQTKPVRTPEQRAAWIAAISRTHIAQSKAPWTKPCEVCSTVIERNGRNSVVFRKIKYCSRTCQNVGRYGVKEKK